LALCKRPLLGRRQQAAVAELADVELQGVGDLRSAFLFFLLGLLDLGLLGLGGREVALDYLREQFEVGLRSRIERCQIGERPLLHRSLVSAPAGAGRLARSRVARSRDTNNEGTPGSL